MAPIPAFRGLMVKEDARISKKPVADTTHRRYFFSKLFLSIKCSQFCLLSGQLNSWNDYARSMVCCHEQRNCQNITTLDSCQQILHNVPFWYFKKFNIWFILRSTLVRAQHLENNHKMWQHTHILQTILKNNLPSNIIYLANFNHIYQHTCSSCSHLSPFTASLNSKNSFLHGQDRGLGCRAGRPRTGSFSIVSLDSCQPQYPFLGTAAPCWFPPAGKAILIFPGSVQTQKSYVSLGGLHTNHTAVRVLWL